MEQECKYAKPEHEEDESYYICRLMGGKVEPERCNGCRWRKEQ